MNTKRLLLTGHSSRSVPSARQCLGAIMITSAIVILSLMVGLPSRTNAVPPSGFTITPLLLPNGSSEPEISIGLDGTMGMVSLQWLFDPTNFGTDLWTGAFTTTGANFQGVIDANLQHPGKSIFGAGDADVDIGSSGRLHATTLVFLFNPFNNAQLGVSAITCPSPAGGFSIKNCTEQLIDTSQTDRPWITSEGRHVYISYHDSGNSTLIHAQRSDDDGFTWRKIGDPIVGQGSTTGQSTFNNV